MSSSPALTLWAAPGHAQPVERLAAARVRQRFPAHMHDTFAIGVVEQGSSVTRYRGGMDVHAPGGVIVIEPGEMHTGEPCDAEGWTYRMLYPSAEQLAAITGAPADALAAGGLLARSFVEDETLAARFAAAHALLGTPDGASTRGDEAMAETLGDLLRAHAGPAAPRADDARPRAVRVVREYLHDRHASRVTLADLTALVSLSPYHLVRTFRRAVGVPPHAYLALVRVERARALLRRGVLVRDAAREAGFCDPSHLTRFFRRVTGLTPGEYARSWRAWRVA